MRYKIIELEQNTPEWLAFRLDHVGASDAPIIMGKSPYKKEYDLYLEKTGFMVNETNSWVMQRGHDLEPIAREIVCDKFMEIIPMTIESKEFPWISASLDGINKLLGCICEIKCNGAKTHHMVQAGEIPEHHMIQMQHQLMVSHCDKCLYFSFNPQEECPSVGIWVEPDLEMQKEIFEKEKKFWGYVCDLNYPESEIPLRRRKKLHE